MRDLARLAIAAFGRQGEGSGVIGVDVQRIRRALGLRSEPQPDLPPEDPRREGLPRDSCAASSSCCAASSSAARSSAPSSCRPSARSTSSTARCRPAPLQDLAAVHRVVAQLKRRLKTQGQEHRGPKRRVARRRAPHDARVAGDRRRPGRHQDQAGPPAPPGDLRAVRRLDHRHERVGVLPLSVMHALHDSFRKMRSFVFIERISEVTDVFPKERDFKAVREAIGRDAGVADISGYTDYGRVWTEFRAARRGRPAPARDGHRPRRRAHQRPRPARRHLRPDRREGRPHVLAQPRAAPVLELRRLGDLRLRGALRGVRVLDDPAARGLRQGADAADPRVSGATLPEPSRPLPRQALAYWRVQAADRRHRRDGRWWRPPPAGSGARRAPRARHRRRPARSRGGLAALALRDPRRGDRPALRPADRSSGRSCRSAASSTSTPRAVRCRGSSSSRP